jgi:hypothetical protein
MSDLSGHSCSHLLKRTNIMSQDYFKPREKGEIDLVAEVRQILISNGLGQSLDAYDTNRFVTEASDKCSSVQRFQLNRYFSMQLIMAPVDSTEERFCLIPNGDVSDWLTLFKSKVVPFMIQHNLPKPI